MSNSISACPQSLICPSRIHSLKGVVDSLRLPRHALSTIMLLGLQLLYARRFALLQLLGVDGANRRQRIGNAAVTALLRRYDLAGGDARKGDDVVIAGLGGGVGGCVSPRVDGDDVQHGTRGEECALVCLRVWSCGRDLHSLDERSRSVALPPSCCCLLQTSGLTSRQWLCPVCSASRESLQHSSVWQQIWRRCYCASPCRPWSCCLARRCPQVQPGTGRALRPWKCPSRYWSMRASRSADAPQKEQKGVTKKKNSRIEQKQNTAWSLRTGSGLDNVRGDEVKARGYV